MLPKIVKFNELPYKVIGGQILSRVVADPARGDAAVDKGRKTIVAKSIGDGFVDDDNLLINDYKTEPDLKRLTVEGDIIIKLTPPYNAAFIDKEHGGLLVSSFCSIIRFDDVSDSVIKVSPNYLVAYLNSELCQQKLSSTICSTTIPTLSSGKIMDLTLPVVDEEQMNKVANEYALFVKNQLILKKIVELQNERFNVIFAEMESE